MGLIFAGLSARWPMRLHPAESLDPSTLLLVAMAGAYGALCGVLAITLSRRFLFVVAEQSGSLCWRCGYDLGAASISVCPECGTQAAPAHFRLARPIRLFDRLARRGRVFLIMLAVSAGAWCTSRVFTRVIPTYQFYSAFGGWGQPGDPGHTWLYVPSGRTPSGLWDGAAACLPFDDDPSRGLIVAYWPGGPPGAPRGIRMRIQYVQMPQPAAMPAGAPPVCYPDEGSVRIYADLNAEQARRVVRENRVPPELAAALRNRATEQAWTMPAGGPVGLRPVPESPVDASQYLR